MAIMEIAVEPIGADAHMHELVAECVKVIRDSGLRFHIGPMATVVQGLPDELYRLAAQVHRVILDAQLAPRIIVNMRIDDNRLGEHSLDDRVRIIEREVP